MTGYLFDNAWREERKRLKLLEAGWDPVTIGQLQQAGVAAGWRCLEVGAGGGSIAGWLAGKVGPAGHVVATDLDPRFVEVLPNANLEVRNHDIVADDLEVAAFDLVHTRLLLEHLPQREAALDKLVSALKPSGWLVVEEFDHVTFAPEPVSTPDFLDAWSGFAPAFAALANLQGLDLSYGNRLPGELHRRGLVEVTATGHTQAQRGGSPLSEVLVLSLLKMSNGLVATGVTHRQTLERLVGHLRNPASCWTSQLMVSARGRKPG
jgi:SAM-dependent methyltransferase